MTARARPNPLLAERISRQGLATRDCPDVVTAAARTVAIQAQDAPASRLGLRARTAAATEADVAREIAVTRRVTRTWLMRGTIHLVATDDLRWLVRLIGPSIVRRYRTRWAQLGLSEDVLERGLAALPEILADGPRSRAEIAGALAARRITPGSPDPQAPTHVVLHASAVGLLCRGPDDGRTATFALLEQWVPGSPGGPSGDEAVAELARRYFAAFSPATAADFATWSGLAGTRSVGLIRDELEPVDVDGAPGFRLGRVEPARGVRLLPPFDNYLLGYRDRTAILAAGLQPRVYQGGLIRATVTVDGRVVGAWSLVRAGRGRQVTLEPFEDWTSRTRRAVEAEIDDLARFLDSPLELAFA